MSNRLYGCRLQRHVWVFLALSIILSTGCDAEQQTEEEDAACHDQLEFFATQVHDRVLSRMCAGCHTAGGAAANSEFILFSDSRPDFMEENQETVLRIARRQVDGVSLLLLKPTGQESHGGGRVIDDDSEEYSILADFIDMTDQPVECTGQPNTNEHDMSAVEKLPPTAALRKASLMLVGRLPTDSERASVDQGGEPALSRVLRAQMEERAFSERMKELWNDILLTDRYLPGTRAVSLLDDDRYSNRYWYEAESESSVRREMRSRTNIAIAREPLELIAFIIENKRPFTEIITGDYTVVNAYSAMSYGIPSADWPDIDDPDSHVFRQAKLTDIPHAGIMTTTTMLNRYPTTGTNRNRHRAWFFYKTFLATDILHLANRPIDDTASEIHNPTMNDVQCAVCHSVMDPVAGAFQNWDEYGRYVLLDDGWYTDMRPPGVDTIQLPASERAHALRWLGEQTVQDSRFSYAIAQAMLAALTGLPTLASGTGDEEPALADARDAQRAYITKIAQQFTDSGYKLDELVLAIVTGHYFRAMAKGDAGAAGLVLAGTAHLLTPEELDRKVTAITGHAWASNSGNSYLMNKYKLLYGGIDSDAVQTRLSRPNGLIANIGLRMATEMSCQTVPRDFVLAAEERRLFPFVELSFRPYTDDGFSIPDAQLAIKNNIRHMLARMLGEHHDIDHEEVETAYRLFVDTWKEGKQKVQDELLEVRLPSPCRLYSFNGESLPDEQIIRDDPDYTIRAWMAVTTYLLSDYRFLYE